MHPLHPLGGEKHFSALIYRKNVQVHPQDTKCTLSQFFKEILGQFLLGDLGLEVYLDGL